MNRLELLVTLAAVCILGACGGQNYTIVRPAPASSSWHRVATIGVTVDYSGMPGSEWLEQQSQSERDRQEQFRARLEAAFLARLRELLPGIAVEPMDGDETHVIRLRPLSLRLNLGLGATWEMTGTAEMSSAELERGAAETAAEIAFGVSISSGVDDWERWLAIQAADRCVHYLRRLAVAPDVGGARRDRPMRRVAFEPNPSGGRGRSTEPIHAGVMVNGPEALTGPVESAVRAALASRGAQLAAPQAAHGSVEVQGLDDQSDDDRARAAAEYLGVTVMFLLTVAEPAPGTLMIRVRVVRPDGVVVRFTEVPSATAAEWLAAAIDEVLGDM